MKAANQTLTIVTDERSDGWKLVPIKDVADINPKLDKSTIPDKLMVSFVPMRAVGAGDGTIDVSNLRPAAEVKNGFTNFQESDVLFAKITPCMENGKMAVVPKVASGYGFGSTEFHVLRPKDGNDPRYLYYFVSSQSVRKEAAHNMTGAVGQKRVSTSYISDLEIPLASPDQQRLIVAEIEKQFSRLDEAVANLKRVKANLKRYKAAVLKAAVEGKLTEEWRKAHPDAEPANELLKRILVERRKKWVEAKLAKMKSKGKKPKEDKWKERYREPDNPDIAQLPDLPSGWTWASPEQLAAPFNYALSIGPFGSNLKVSDYKDSGVPLVFVRNIRSKIFDGDGTKYVSLKKAKELAAHEIQPGDILITKMGAPPGDACLYPLDMPKAIITADCIKWTLTPILNAPSFFVDAINSQLLKAQILRITQGVAQLKVSLGRFKNIAIPLPPLREQKAVMDEVESRLTSANKIEEDINITLSRAERLRQSVLKKAFSGNLMIGA